MRVATFNLLSGKSPEDNTVREDRLIDAVKTLDADIVGLQEVDQVFFEPQARTLIKQPV